MIHKINYAHVAGKGWESRDVLFAVEFWKAENK